MNGRLDTICKAIVVGSVQVPFMPGGCWLAGIVMFVGAGNGFCCNGYDVEFGVAPGFFFHVEDRL